MYIVDNIFPIYLCNNSYQICTYSNPLLAHYYTIWLKNICAYAMWILKWYNKLFGVKFACFSHFFNYMPAQLKNKWTVHKLYSTVTSQKQGMGGKRYWKPALQGYRLTRFEINWQCKNYSNNLSCHVWEEKYVICLKRYHNRPASSYY